MFKVELEVNGAARFYSNSITNYLQQRIYWEQGHIYYYCVYGISDGYQTIACDVENVNGTYFAFMANPRSWTKGSSYFTQSFSGYKNISINYGATTNTSYVDDICIVDLTEAFGKGNEPSKEWCDSNINYFNGSTTVIK